LTGAPGPRGDVARRTESARNLWRQIIERIARRANRRAFLSQEAEMTLKEKITDDMRAAMRAKDAPRLSAIRLLLAAVKQKEVDERIVVDDAMVLAIVDKLLKQRKDSLAQFLAAGRADLADKEAAEVELLSTYLPAQLSEAELDAAIDAAVSESGANGAAAIGKVMAILKPRLAGRADLSRASAQVKKRLAG